MCVCVCNRAKVCNYYATVCTVALFHLKVHFTTAGSKSAMGLIKFLQHLQLAAASDRLGLACPALLCLSLSSWWWRQVHYIFHGITLINFVQTDAALARHCWGMCDTIADYNQHTIIFIDCAVWRPIGENWRTCCEAIKRPQSIKLVAKLSLFTLGSLA